MSHVTYEYPSKGSPVVMYEKVNGYTVAIYTAYIDRHANGWWLYPKERLRTSEIKFEKKYVSIMKVTILPPIKSGDVPPTTRHDAAAVPQKEDKQVTLI